MWKVLLRLALGFKGLVIAGYLAYPKVREAEYPETNIISTITCRKES